MEDMAKNRNANNGGNDGEGAGEKTFTQEELDRIITERLAREKAKQPDLDQREKALEKRERALEARELLQTEGLPESFIDFVAGAEDMKAAAGLIRQGIAEYEKAGKAKNKGGAYTPAGGNPPDHEADVRRKFGLLD